jgi:hypothetical protein
MTSKVIPNKKASRSRGQNQTILNSTRRNSLATDVHMLITKTESFIAWPLWSNKFKTRWDFHLHLRDLTNLFGNHTVKIQAINLYIMVAKWSCFQISNRLTLKGLQYSVAHTWFPTRVNINSMVGKYLQTHMDYQQSLAALSCSIHISIASATSQEVLCLPTEIKWKQFYLYLLI